MSAINVRLDTFKNCDYINILEAFARARDIYSICVYFLYIYKNKSKKKKTVRSTHIYYDVENSSR